MSLGRFLTCSAGGGFPGEDGAGVHMAIPVQENVVQFRHTVTLAPAAVEGVLEALCALVAERPRVLLVYRGVERYEDVEQRNAPVRVQLTLGSDFDVRGHLPSPAPQILAAPARAAHSRTAHARRCQHNRRRCRLLQLCRAPYSIAALDYFKKKLIRMGQKSGNRKITEMFRFMSLWTGTSSDKFFSTVEVELGAVNFFLP